MKIRSIGSAALVFGFALTTLLAPPVMAEAKDDTRNLTDCAVTAQAPNASTPISYLFVFDGRNAELKPVKGSTGKFELTVPIRNSDHLVTWFTDRPNRDAGHMRFEDFAYLWQQEGNDTFKADPPNVAISFEGKTLVATMTRPKVVTSKGRGQALKSTMTLVKGSDLVNLSKSNRHLGSHAKRAVDNDHQGAKKIDVVTVFVDDLFSVDINCGPCRSDFIKFCSNAPNPGWTTKPC
jgi:hypothetical protein